MPERLSQQKIRDALTDPKAFSEIIIVDSVDSTNDALYQYAKQHPNERIVFLAEGQTSGKGRQGKSWFSPPFQNIYCSIAWPFDCPVTAIADLSHIIGKTVITALHQLGIDNKLALKQPNDILYDQKKLAGILIETFGNSDQTTAIIGIGCNVHLEDDQKQIDQPWTSLDLITQTINDRNHVISIILSAVAEHFIATPHMGQI